MWGARLTYMITRSSMFPFLFFFNLTSTMVHRSSTAPVGHRCSPSCCLINRGVIDGLLTVGQILAKTTFSSSSTRVQARRVLLRNLTQALHFIYSREVLASRQDGKWSLGNWKPFPRCFCAFCGEKFNQR